MQHQHALSFLISADAALLFLPIGDIQSYSGKIFEYFMIKRPILAGIEPEGTCAALLRQIGQSDWIVPPANSERLCEAITSLAEKGWPRPDNNQIDQFSRKSLTGRLASRLKDTIEHHTL
jgi:hypothetical protein